MPDCLDESPKVSSVSQLQLADWSHKALCVFELLRLRQSRAIRLTGRTCIFNISVNREDLIRLMQTK